MLEDPRRQKQLQNLLTRLGLIESSSVDWLLLDLALTHPSISREKNYQQLEFVGDAVIRLAAAEILMEVYPNDPVGEFAAIRSILVSDRFLAEFADFYGVERYLTIDPKAASDRVGRQSRLADAFEAILGALYLSTYTMKLIRPWLDEPLKKKAEEIRQDPARQNYKDALQEWTQGRHKILPEYRVKENKKIDLDGDRFSAEVWLQDRLLGTGTGRTKKSAEQAAAKEAFLGLNGV
jgi:ribonuclease III